MNKKSAVLKARQGISAGDLTAILNDAQEQATSQSSKVNPAFTKRQVWDMFHGAIGNQRSSEIVESAIAANILREFAPNETAEAMSVSSASVIPF